MRRTAAEKSAGSAQRISSPLVRYDDQGRLVCKVCERLVGGDSLWQSHQSSGAHAAALSALKAKAASVRASNAVPPVHAAAKPPSKTATNAVSSVARSVSAIPSDFFDGASAAPSSQPIVSLGIQPPAKDNPKAGDARVAPTSSASLPAGFFDDIETDLRARGIDPKAVAQAAEAADWQEFQDFAAEVATSAAADDAAEEARYEERSTLADVENALYRARMDVVHFVRRRLQGQDAPPQQQDAGDSASANGDGPSRKRPRTEGSDESAGAGGSVVEDEFMGSLSLLTSSAAPQPVGSVASSNGRGTNGGISAQELAATLQKRWASKPGAAPPAPGGSPAVDGTASDSDDDGGEDYLSLVDWRRKGV